MPNITLHFHFIFLLLFNIFIIIYYTETRKSKCIFYTLPIDANFNNFI